MHTKKLIYIMKNLKKEIKFNQWLAGLIDGDGCFGVTQKNYTNCEITVGLEDSKMLYLIQNKFGGSVKLRSGVKAIRYRLSNKPGMINLINAVNGNIRNSKRIVQFYRICEILDIPVLPTIPLTLKNSWISGYFDANGTINYYLTPPHNIPQLHISIKNKYLYDVEMFKTIFGGSIFFYKSQNGYFKWSITNKTNHLNYLEYNKICPSRSFKGQRIFLIQEFYKLYNLKAYKKDQNDPILYKAWLQFDTRWNRKIFSEIQNN